MPPRALAATGIVALAFVLGWLLFIGLPRAYTPKPSEAAAPQPVTTQAPSGSPARKITATLFYVSEDGLMLMPVQKEVPFADNVADQARAIVESQLLPSPPLVSAVPVETKLRDVFVTERGDAFVDLSGDVSARHSGGALDELLTIYTIVNAVTANLPAVTHVQILIDGKEVETLAGHVDLRHPLAKGLQWVAHDTH